MQWGFLFGLLCNIHLFVNNNVNDGIFFIKLIQSFVNNNTINNIKLIQIEICPAGRIDIYILYSIFMFSMLVILDWDFLPIIDQRIQSYATGKLIFRSNKNPRFFYSNFDCYRFSHKFQWYWTLNQTRPPPKWLNEIIFDITIIRIKIYRFDVMNTNQWPDQYLSRILFDYEKKSIFYYIFVECFRCLLRNYYFVCYSLDTRILLIYKMRFVMRILCITSNKYMHCIIIIFNHNW